MSARARLPNRRASTTFTFDCGPHRYVATVSYFPGTDRLAEIFLGNGRAGSDIDAAAKDSAVVASIALQHGVPVDVIRKALLRSQGKASSPLDTVLRPHRRAGGRVMSATKDPWNPPHLCPCGSSEEFDPWICVHVSGSADAPVWMHASCLRKFARGELENVQIDECELFRSWYCARNEGPKAK